MKVFKHIVLAISGASGIVYGWRLLDYLLHTPNIQTSLLLSENARLILNEECRILLPENPSQARELILQKMALPPKHAFQVYAPNNWNAPIASGSGAPDAMVICPASMNLIAHVACGLSDNLMQRAADVVLKMRRPFIVVPRESPFSTLHLENLLKLSQNGAMIFPAAPAFYHHPQNLEHLIDFFIHRILDVLNCAPENTQRWGKDLFCQNVVF